VGEATEGREADEMKFLTMPSHAEGSIQVLEGSLLTSTFNKEQTVLCIDGCLVPTRPRGVHDRQEQTEGEVTLSSRWYDPSYIKPVLGVLEATDDELTVLKDAGYQIPDLRDVRLADWFLGWYMSSKMFL
jgi:hypothetical protein